MSADALPRQVERCYAAGMVDHIAKPIQREVLYAKIERWLRRPAAGGLAIKSDRPGESRDPDRTQGASVGWLSTMARHPQTPPMNLGPGFRRGERMLGSRLELCPLPPNLTANTGEFLPCSAAPSQPWA
jgi:hypothetical protein